nr:hypothetical protein CFP56_26493 [Quercus suber]
MSHKEYAIEMVNSIIKDTNLDECGVYSTKDLGVSGLFDLARPYYDECNGFYGDGFDDCLKLVTMLYAHLDLSQVVIDDTILPTPGGANAIMNEVDDVVHFVEEVEEPADVETIDQHVPDGSAAPKGSFVL